MDNLSRLVVYFTIEDESLFIEFERDKSSDYFTKEQWEWLEKTSLQELYENDILDYIEQPELLDDPEEKLIYDIIIKICKYHEKEMVDHTVF